MLIQHPAVHVVPDGDKLLVHHTETGQRIRLDPAAVSFLQCFAEPVHAAEVLSQEPWVSANATDLCRFLLQRRFLVPADAVSLEALVGRTGLLGVPTTTVEALEADGAEHVDAAFLGLAYDHGAGGQRGSAFAPAFLRSWGLLPEWQAHARTLRLKGLYDSAGDTLLGDGLGLRDLGDIHSRGVAAGHLDRATYFRSVTNVIERLLHLGVLPVVFGGDHSCYVGSVTGLI